MATGDYIYVANRVLTVVRLHDDYDSENSSLGDFSVIDAGVDRSLVITPGPSPLLGRAGSTVMRRWEMVADFIVRIGGLDDATAWLNFATDRDALIRHVESYPSLNLLAGITSVSIEANGEPLAIPTASGDDDSNLSEFWQELMIGVNVKYELTTGEYA